MAKFLDDFLCTILVFLLTFAWTAYCLHSWQVALVLATVVSLCAAYVIFRLLTRHQTRTETKKKRKKTLSDFAIFLQFNSDNSALFLPMFCYYKYETSVVDFDNIIISKTQRVFVTFCYQTGSVSPLQIQQATVAAKRQNCQKLLVFGNKIDNGLLALANTQITAKFVDVANAYDLLEHAEMLPDLPQINAPKQHLLPQIAFNKKRFWWYFFGAAYTLVLSFFSYFKVYLLVWATVMLCLAVYSLTNRRYNKIPTSFSLSFDE